MSDIFDSKDYFDSELNKLPQFQVNPFPSLNDELAYEPESNIGVATPENTISKKLDILINRIHYDDIYYNEKICEKSNEGFSLIYDINIITKPMTIIEKYEREDNCRRMIGRDIFNHYFKHTIEGYIKENKLILCFEFFPKEFIFKVTNKGGVSYLNKTIEELIEDKELYNDTKPKSNFENNLKVIKAIKNKNESNININENNFDGFLKKTYRELIKDYLSSKEYKQKINQLSKEGNEEANRYKFFSEKFVDNFHD